MRADGLVTRQELAKLVGVNSSSFWVYVLDYNAKAEARGWPPLKPDHIEQHLKHKKFFFNPARVAEFKAALAKRKEKSHES